MQQQRVLYAEGAADASQHDCTAGMVEKALSPRSQSARLLEQFDRLGRAARHQRARRPIGLARVVGGAAMIRGRVRGARAVGR
jgi:hypothetical protein